MQRRAHKSFEVSFSIKISVVGSRNMDIYLVFSLLCCFYKKFYEFQKKTIFFFSKPYFLLKVHMYNCFEKNITKKKYMKYPYLWNWLFYQMSEYIIVSETYVNTYCHPIKCHRQFLWIFFCHEFKKNQIKNHSSGTNLKELTPKQKTLQGH